MEKGKGKEGEEKEEGRNRGKGEKGVEEGRQGGYVYMVVVM